MTKGSGGGLPQDRKVLKQLLPRSNSATAPSLRLIIARAPHWCRWNQHSTASPKNHRAKVDFTSLLYSMSNETTSKTGSVTTWGDEATKLTDRCRQRGCERLAVSGPYKAQDYCDQREFNLPLTKSTPAQRKERIDSCHVCHQAPAVVQFMNEQGFCSACKCLRY